jgi:hypothetical protein
VFIAPLWCSLHRGEDGRGRPFFFSRVAFGAEEERRRRGGRQGVVRAMCQGKENFQGKTVKFGAAIMLPNLCTVASSLMESTVLSVCVRFAAVFSILAFLLLLF